MTTLSEFLKLSSDFAKDYGTEKHKQLEFAAADSDIVRAHPEIAQFFADESQAEVPIAGYIDGKFVSKRIDRLVVNGNKIEFLDYKTDKDKNKNHDKYIVQLSEYAALLRDAFPGANVRGYILWLHDWTLEKII